MNKGTPNITFYIAIFCIFASLDVFWILSAIFDVVVLFFVDTHNSMLYIVLFINLVYNE